MLQDLTQYLLFLAFLYDIRNILAILTDIDPEKRIPRYIGGLFLSCI